MHVMVTDSGVGGLSVVAYAEQYLRERACSETVRLTFVNASPSNEAGYNSMPTVAEKVATFDRFLRLTSDRFRPDAIYVACNSLSVLLPSIPFVHEGTVATTGIVETGLEQIAARIDERDARPIAIFATVTTVDAGTYESALTARGIGQERIVSQACPGLADVISEDREGAATLDAIRHWVRTAGERFPSGSSRCIAYMGCTHYGYRAALWRQAFEEIGITAEVVDPNRAAVGDVIPESLVQDASGRCNLEVNVVSRYVIPESTIENLTHLLGAIAPESTRALRSFEHAPDLF